ncbi:MAG: DUF1302 family protein [Paraglaciecola sp.]
MRCIAILLGLILTTFYAKAEIRGEFQSKMSVGESGINQFEHITTPSFTYSGENFRFYSEYRLRVDTADELEPGKFDEPTSSAFSKRMNLSGSAEFEIREFFVDGYLGEVFLKLGKQQIVWGQSDGLRVLDVVNPLNYREFILTGLDERRIPLWSASAEIGLGQWQLQTVWVPDQTYNYLPSGTNAPTFAFTSSLYIPSIQHADQVVLKAPKTRGKIFNDSDFGFRLSTFTENGWDIGVVYFYHYRDESVLYREHVEEALIIQPQFERSHLLGFSASNVLGDVILRSEVGYSTNVHYLTDWSVTQNDQHTSSEVAMVLGLDYQGISNVFLTAQIFASHINHFHHDIIREQTEYQYTMRYEQTFYNETWTLSLQNIQSINREDGLLQLSLEHQYSSSIILSLGCDIFYGAQHGLFGQFKDKDRVSMALNYSF